LASKTNQNEMLGAGVIKKHLPLFIQLFLSGLGRAGFIFIPVVLTLFPLFLTNCRKESVSNWSKRDSTAVFEEIEKWRDTFNFNSFFSATRHFSVFTQLNAQDSISNNGDSLIKIYHLIQTQDTVSLLYHRDSLAFLVETDTFCNVEYEDYATHTISIFKCDTAWIVQYQKNPPDTIWRLATAEKRPFTTGEFGKVYAWSAPRKLRLKKQSGEYHLGKFGGLTVSTPFPESAPGILYVVLETPGISDTWDKTRVDSLIDSDSLFSAGVNESLTVSIKSEDADTVIKPYYFFVWAGKEKVNITNGARIGQGKIVFENSGIKHIDIEVLPGRNLFYPNSSYSSTIWSVPIRVR